MNVLTYTISLLFACFSTIALAQELQPGDKGYMHDETHGYYQQLFDSNRCHCAVGECRPTIWRTDPTSPTKMEVKINEYWIDVPVDALLKPAEYPPELLQFPAHVCAYPTLPGASEGALKFGIKVECVIISGTS